MKGLSEHRNDFSFSSADKEIVILQRNMDYKEIIRQQTGTETTDVGQLYSPLDFDCGWVNVVESSV